MEKQKVLYVAGIGRNGGTLIDRIMGELDGFFSMGEVRHVWLKGVVKRELCTCGERFTECAVWRDVFERGFGGFDRLDGAHPTAVQEKVDRFRYLPLLLSPVRPPAFQHALDEYVELWRHFYRGVREATQARVLVNSSKSAEHALILRELPEIELYILHLVRDSRAAVHSWQKNIRLPDQPDDVTYMPRFSAFGAAARWSGRNVSAGLLRRHFKHYRVLRYEDLVDRPEEHVRGIIEWLGEPVGKLPFIDSHTVDLGLSHLQSGNPMRYQNGAVKIRKDEAWRGGMGAGTRRLVTALTYPLLREYGYFR